MATPALQSEQILNELHICSKWQFDFNWSHVSCLRLFGSKSLVQWRTASGQQPKQRTVRKVTGPCFSAGKSNYLQLLCNATGTKASGCFSIKRTPSFYIMHTAWDELNRSVCQERSWNDPKTWTGPNEPVVRIRPWAWMGRYLATYLANRVNEKQVGLDRRRQFAHIFLGGSWVEVCFVCLAVTKSNNQHH